MSGSPPDPEGSKPSAVIIAVRAPGRHAAQAGHRICARNIVQIAGKFAVDLIIVCKEGEELCDIPFFRQLCRTVTVITVTRWEGLLNVVTHPHKPLPVAGRSSRRIESAIKGALQPPYKLAHFEWTEAAAYSGLINAQSRQLFCHDILTELFGRRAQRTKLGKPFWWLQTALVRSFERSVLSEMDTVFALSRADAHDLVQLGARGQIAVVGPEFYSVKPVPKVPRVPIRLLFWGAFSRPENREAATFLCEQILPRLSPSQYHVTLAGGQSDVHFHSTERIRVTGYVDDVASVFNDSDIAVFPLFQGSGLKIKVLESLHAGLPVVTTRVGAEGFDCGERDGMFLAETTEEFVEKIEQITKDPGLLRRASLAAAVWATRYKEETVFSVV